MAMKMPQVLYVDVCRFSCSVFLHIWYCVADCCATTSFFILFLLYSCSPLLFAGVVPDRVVPLKYVVRMADPPPKPVLSRMSTSNSSSSLANMYGGSDSFY